MYLSTADRWELEYTEVLRNFWGGNFSLRRSDYLRAMDSGPLSVRRHEDRELGLRLGRLGVLATFDRSLAGTHEHSRTFRQSVDDAYWMGHGKAVLARLYPETVRPPAVDPAPVFLALRASALGVLSGCAGQIRARRLEMSAARHAWKLAHDHGARAAHLDHGSSEHDLRLDMLRVHRQTRAAP